MAIAITAAEQDVYPPRVLVSVTGLAGGEAVNISRVVTAQRTTVRAGEGIASGTAYLALDAELPFGVPVSYVATVDGVEYTTSSATHDLPDGATLSKPAFTDAINGLTAEAVIVSWPDKEYTRDSAVLQLADGYNAVIQGPIGQYASTLTLFTETTSARGNLEALVAGAAAGTIQIRQGGAYSGVDSYINVLSFRVQRFSQDGTDERRLFVLEVVEVAAWPVGLTAQGYTYADLEALYDSLTYTDLASDYATYLDLAQADLS